MNIFDTYINEDFYPELNTAKCISDLQEALRCNTSSYDQVARNNYAEFAKLQQLIRDSFPNIMKKGTMEIISHSVLITIPGNDPTLKPALFMAHQDVVPVISPDKWLHDPFSGDLDEGYIWGRGALDIKNMLIGILEAAEHLLSQGHVFRRTVLMAFGEDEETMNTGNKKISSILQERGIILEYAIDESGRLRSSEAFGTDGKYVFEIGLVEKGYLDLKLSCDSTGGHSSNPFNGTSLGKMAQAIAAIVNHPLPPVLNDSVLTSLKTLKPYIEKEPLRTLVQDIDGNREQILQYYLSQPELFNQVITTIAPTMITPGAPGSNVMPNAMEAVINFRLAPQDTVETVLQHCYSLLPEGVSTSILHQTNATATTSPDTYGFQNLQKILYEFFDGVLFVPGVNVAFTDIRYYEPICDCCMRMGPFLEDIDIKAEGVHGINERISVRAYLQGIRVIARMMETTC